MTRKEQIKQEAEEYAEKHGFRIPYDRSNEYYDKTDVKASLDGFIEGAQWADQHPSVDTVKKIICYALKYTNIMLADDLENGIKWELLIKKAIGKNNDRQRTN